MELLFAKLPLWAIAVVRVTLGVIFLAYGSQKVLGWCRKIAQREGSGLLWVVEATSPNRKARRS